MRLLLLPVLATFALGLISAPSALAQSRTGVINFQNAVLSTAEYKKAIADLQTKFKPRQDALNKARQALTDIETQLRSSQGQLSSAGAAELQANGQRKQVEVQRLDEDLREDSEREQQAAIRLVSTRMGEVLKKLAEDKQLDVIVDTASVPFFRPEAEVTDQAVAAYDAAHPAK